MHKPRESIHVSITCACSAAFAGLLYSTLPEFGIIAQIVGAAFGGSVGYYIANGHFRRNMLDDVRNGEPTESEKAYVISILTFCITFGAVALLVAAKLSATDIRVEGPELAFFWLPFFATCQTFLLHFGPKGILASLSAR